MVGERKVTREAIDLLRTRTTLAMTVLESTPMALQPRSDERVFRKFLLSV